MRSAIGQASLCRYLWRRRRCRWPRRWLSPLAPNLCSAVFHSTLCLPRPRTRQSSFWAAACLPGRLALRSACRSHAPQELAANRAAKNDGDASTPSSATALAAAQVFLSLLPPQRLQRFAVIADTVAGVLRGCIRRPRGAGLRRRQQALPAVIPGGQGGTGNGDGGSLLSFALSADVAPPGVDVVCWRAGHGLPARPPRVGRDRGRILAAGREDARDPHPRPRPRL